MNFENLFLSINIKFILCPQFYSIVIFVNILNQKKDCFVFERSELYIRKQIEIILSILKKSIVN